MEMTMSKLDSIRPVLEDALVAVQRAGIFRMSRDLGDETEKVAMEKLRKLRDTLNAAGDDFALTPAEAMLNKCLAKLTH
jgi:hypothetical protein